MIEPEPDLRQLFRALFAELLDEAGDLLKLAGRWLRPHHHHRHLPLDRTHAGLIFTRSFGASTVQAKVVFSVPPSPSDPANAVSASSIVITVDGAAQPPAPLDLGATSFDVAQPVNEGQQVSAQITDTNRNGDRVTFNITRPATVTPGPTPPPGGDLPLDRTDGDILFS